MTPTTTLACLFALAASVSAGCSSFTPDGSYYTYSTEKYFNEHYVAPPHSFVASYVVTCLDGSDHPNEGTSLSGASTGAGLSACEASNITSGCALTVDSMVELYGFNNASISRGDASSLYSLLPQTGLGLNMVDSFCETANGASFCIKNGESKYGLVLPIYVCINGTLDGCSGGPVNSGTAVQICGIQVDTSPSGTFITGAIGAVNTTDPTSIQFAGSRQCSGSAGLSTSAIFAAVVASIAVVLSSHI